MEPRILDVETGPSTKRYRDAPSDKMTGDEDRTSRCDFAHVMQLSRLTSMNRLGKPNEERRLPR